MASTKAQNDSFRASGIGRKYPLGDHYANGVRNGQNAVKRDPAHARWYEVQARSQARNDYADWPPYRAYQLGFARGVRAS